MINAEAVFWISRLNQQLERKPLQTRTPISGRNTRLEGLNRPESSQHVEKMATRTGTLTPEMILWPGSNVSGLGGVRFPFKLLIQSRTPVSRRNIGKRPVRILYIANPLSSSTWSRYCML